MVSEEYSVLRMNDLRPLRQALLTGKNGEHSCDALTVSARDGKEQIIYFTIDRVLADEMKVLGFKKP